MPSVCTRQDIFGTSSSEEGESLPIDPDSLAERVRAHPDVTNFVPVEGAAVSSQSNTIICYMVQKVHTFSSIEFLLNADFEL